MIIDVYKRQYISLHLIVNVEGTAAVGFVSEDKAVALKPVICLLSIITSKYSSSPFASLVKVASVIIRLDS